VDVYLTYYDMEGEVEQLPSNSNNTAISTTPSEFQLVLQQYGPIEQWKTERINDFSNLFNAKRNFRAATFAADLSSWDLSNAEAMIDMFLDAEAIDFDVSKWDVTKGMRFNGMFDGATNFTGRGLENWNVQNGRFFQRMFRNTISLNSTLDLSGWNVRRAETMEGMFSGSNFGLSSNLCSWPYNKLYPTVLVTDMFVGSNCPDVSDPQLTQRATEPISFCQASCDVEYQQYFGDNQGRPNILFIMTDQQRYDAIQYVQNRMSSTHYDDSVLKIRTPNLDRLLQSGAFFENAYTQCAVCAPARTTIRTGCTIERTGIQHNDLITEYAKSSWFNQRVSSLKSIDHILVAELGYLSEYYGKWHVPDELMYSKDEDGRNLIHYNNFDYKQEEFFFSDDSDGRKNQRYLEYFNDVGTIDRDAINDGQQYDTYTGYPYDPITLDARKRRNSPTVSGACGTYWAVCIAFDERYVPHLVYHYIPKFDRARH
jgi:hypothetical protein